MNVNQVVQAAVAVSQPVKDAVLSSLSWSGAGRVANAIISGEEVSTLDTQMAKLACNISTDRIRPTTEGVIQLLMQEPEPAVLTEAQRKVLVESGESETAIDAQLQIDYQASLERHTRQKALVKQHEARITEALNELFAYKRAKLPEFPESMTELRSKVIAKVANRKPRIVSDLSYGRISAEEVKSELRAINEFLEKIA